MREYARQRGLRRLMMPVPVLTPRLSSLWLGLITPLYARVGRKLVEGLRNETVVRDDERAQPLRRPAARHQRGDRPGAGERGREFAATRWSDALSSGRPAAGWRRRHGRLAPGRLPRRAGPGAAAGPSRPSTHRRAAQGWYYGNCALAPARPARPALSAAPARAAAAATPPSCAAGDTRRLLARRGHRARPPPAAGGRDEAAGTGLAAVRGRAGRPGGSIIRQTAIFDPAGLLGRVYWYALWPVHGLVFGNMIRAIARAAEQDATESR